MDKIIVTDIFGRTNALEKLADTLAGDVSIFDSYEGIDMDFASETEAYMHGFMTYHSQQYNVKAYEEYLKYIDLHQI